MVPASASTPTLISGRANFACSSITMMSVPSTISKPPPQAMPLTAAMMGLVRFLEYLTPAKPPTPQSESDSSAPVAALRSQPGEKNRSPAPVTMAMRNSGSSRNAVTTSFKRRLALRSMALAFGRSMVISRMAPFWTVRTPSDMDPPSGDLLQADHRIDRDRAQTCRAHDHGVDVDFDQCRGILGGVARHTEDGVDERGHIGGRLAAEARQQFENGQTLERGVYGRLRPGRQQADAVRQHLREHPAGAEHQHLAKLRVDDDADQNFGDSVGEHFFHQQRVRQLRQPLGGIPGIGLGAHIEHDPAHFGLVREVRAGGLENP